VRAAFPSRRLLACCSRRLTGTITRPMLLPIAWGIARLTTGGVLCCLLLLPGDFNRSLESGSPLYAGCFLAFYSSAVVLYLWLQKSNPGYLKTEESRSLLEDGEMRRRSKDR